MSLDTSVPPTDHLTHLAFICDSSIQEAQTPSLRSLEVKYYILTSAQRVQRDSAPGPSLP